MNPPTAFRILINGIVQGVGFRPFIYNLAIQNDLKGWVRNTSGGVEIEVSGPLTQLDKFLTSITSEAPPLSKIDTIRHETISPDGHETFQIHHSRIIEGGFQPISPDVSICDDCLRELFSPTDFRYRYPFINCTNCGPRFTIIKDIPYDRPKTTMAEFSLCRICEAEYSDPSNRRFHAQPVACPSCGPQIWLEFSPGEEKNEIGESALIQTQKFLTEGKIVAVKGLGGFHLACDGENSAAIQRLRARKNRPHKPLAVMMPDLATVKKYCQLSTAEGDLLGSPQRPILLLDRLPGSTLPENIAPGQNSIGVMLPYTPLHYLLFSEQNHFPEAPYSVLVMTSANFSGNPILTRNQQVRDQLKDIADAFLFHNREIHIHCDDTVARVYKDQSEEKKLWYPIRRSRGYAPQPFISPLGGESVLGVGAELKNTFCITRDNYAFLSQHIGDLKNYETLLSFQEGITHFEGLFRTKPHLLAADLHPDYLSTRYAQERAEREDLPLLSIQHHHAHIAACLADNQYLEEEPVIGMAFDGVGYGDDGRIWGGEFLIADYQEYTRAGALEYFPLPGGDLAIREPWRIGLSILHQVGIPWEEDIPSVSYAKSISESMPGLIPIDVVKQQLTTGTNAPMTSSIGRLFDAVASLTGVCQTISYEGQAAIELEALADPSEIGLYSLDISNENLFRPIPLLNGILADTRKGENISIISARFHNSLAELVLQMALRLKKSHHLTKVALSGGVWQNMSLLDKSIKKLELAGFQVFIHQQIPTNDGGISLGQAVIGQKILTV
ncbi:MAG: carbamoyltransferase HypF [Chloroflexi bacterium]|nr:carbamoyltransferase HypF [Chloroflexota bacterium]